MAKMTPQQLQISALKRERARLEERLRLAELRNMEERKTIEQIDMACARHGYDIESGRLVEWLEARLEK